jgi:alpha-tubulin suppressor-like RCC1 family protein
MKSFIKQKRKISLKYSQKGVTLLLAILTISLVTLIFLAIGRYFLQEFLMSKNIGDSVKAYYLAESGIEKGLFILSQLEKNPNYISFDDFGKWKDNSGLEFSLEIQKINNGYRVESLGEFNGILRKLEVTKKNPLIASLGFGAGSATGEGSAIIDSRSNLWVVGTNNDRRLGVCNNSFAVPNWTITKDKVIDFSSSYTHSLIILNDNSAYGAGQGAYYKGNSSCGFSSPPWNKIQIQIGSQTISSFRKVAAGQQCSALIDTNGVLYLLGFDGVGLSWKKSEFGGFTDVVAGRRFILALNGGNLYVLGENTNGQLGVSGSSVTCPYYSTTFCSPTPVPNMTNINKIAAGTYHSLALKQDGTVWVTGNNYYGQLGLGDNTNRYSWTQTSLTNVIAIAAGYSHSLALKQDGTVWVTGDNSFGQLGLGSNTLNSKTWTPLDPSNFENKKVKAIAAGMFHSLVITEDGSVYVTGQNGYYLGLEYLPTSPVYQWTKVPFFGP